MLNYFREAMNNDKPKSSRIIWFDSLRGISILWIAIFHFFMAYDASRHPWLLGFSSFPAFMDGCAPSSFLETIGCVMDGVLAIVFERGSQAVAVFVVASGFGLTYSLVKKGMPPGGWGRWYRRRLLRLFPLYWLAHLIYLVSPFVARKDPIDYRFLLSLLGDRFYPPDTMFYYLVPAWWYFGLLIQLYLVFPLLFRLLQKLGPARYLALSIVATIFTRYLLVDVFHANSNYAQGAFFMGRLWEFALGMVLAHYYSKHPGVVEEYLFEWKTLVVGIVIYMIGVYSYQPVFFHVFTDGLIGTGLTIILAHCSLWANRLPILRTPLVNVGVYSYGLYLLHQPYVIYFGERLHDKTMLYFVTYAFLILGIISILSMLIEWYVNYLTNNLFYRPK
jgi:peptidoglycan/LPS O-acetylase OafA/YrhL